MLGLLYNAVSEIRYIKFILLQLTCVRFTSKDNNDHQQINEKK